MKLQTACFLCLFATVSGTALSADTHPVANVISLLEQLKATATAEQKEEELAYAKYEYQCGVNKATLNAAVKDEETSIDELSDTIDAKTKEIAVLTDEIAALENEDLKNAATIAAQKTQRDKTNELYKMTKSELEATLKAIQDAVKALSTAQDKTEAALTQAKQRVQIALALVQQWGKDLPTGDAAAHIDKYDFKSGAVIELLKKLESDFQKKLVDATAAETNSMNAHSLATESLNNMQKAVSASKATKTEAKGAAEQELTSAKKDKASTEADKKADSATLEATTQACATKKDEWERRSKTRADEIAAMDSAIEILSKATGVRTKAPTNPVPPPSPVKSAFLQVVPAAATGDRKAQAVDKAMNLLLRAGQAAHSKVLQQLAAEVHAKLTAPYDSGVFQPVVNMIEKMIFRLQKEQTAEDEHKNWCDKELSKTNEMISNKEGKKKDKSASKTVEVATINELTIQIKDAQEMIAKIEQFKAEATEARKVGAKENKLALEDAEKAQKALDGAIAVLTEFYKSSGMVEKEKWEFVQAPVSLPKDPKTWSSEYTGVADPESQPKGILTVLQKILDDYAIMEADTKAQEAVDQKDYDDEMSKADIEKARRMEDVKQKTAEKSERARLVTELTSQLKRNEDELSRTNQYLTDLQKACVEADSTYDARKAARDKEIQALRDAESILMDAFKPTSFMQVRRHSQLA